MTYRIPDSLIAEENARRASALEDDYRQKACGPSPSAAMRLVPQSDVSPILAEARRRRGGAIDPVATYRASGYRAQKAEERPAVAGSSSGIV